MSTRGSAHSGGKRNWARIVALYEVLAHLTPIADCGAEPRSGGRHGNSDRRRGLALVDALTSQPSLKAYHLLPSVRGDPS